jgi:TIR domain
MRPRQPLSGKLSIVGHWLARQCPGERERTSPSWRSHDNRKFRVLNGGTMGSSRRLKVFLSYAPADKDIAALLANTLARRGHLVHSITIADEGLFAGCGPGREGAYNNRYTRERGIDAADVLLLLGSKNSMVLHGAEQDLRTAERSGKQIVVVVFKTRDAEGPVQIPMPRQLAAHLPILVDREDVQAMVDALERLRPQPPMAFLMTGTALVALAAALFSITTVTTGI